MPSPARSIPSRKSKKDRGDGRSEHQERDLLDDFMGVQVKNPENMAAPTSKFGQQTASKPISTHKASAFEESFKLADDETEDMLDTKEVKVNSSIYVPEDDYSGASTDATARSIPTLPSGKKLEINILETWGDMNYLGMTGIEIFDALGQPIEI